MFQPAYTITDRLLAYIKRINTLVRDLNNRRFPHVILVELERTAREVSSHASTSIEGNPLPLTEVKKILRSRPDHIRDSEREVLNYNHALRGLDTMLDKGSVMISLPLIETIHKNVTEGILPSFDCGHVRQKPVVVHDPRTGQVIYLPPDAADVKPLMEALIAYVNKNRGVVDPLILAGIFHKQMVIIHPFMDGNGRTTRLATKALLAEMGLNTFHLFSFERYYNQNVTRYFRSVGEFGNYYDLAGTIDFTRWLEYFTEGIIDELLRVEKLLPDTMVTPETQLQPHHRKLMEYVRKNGFISDRDYAKLVNRAKATRTKDFKKLLALGSIERKGKGKATYYVLKQNAS